MRVVGGLALFAAFIASTASSRASVEISTKPTHNMNCSAGVCAPTAKNADLNATDLANMLASEDVDVETGNGAVTITITAPFSWTSTHLLTLDASYNVAFKAPVEVAGTGSVSIVVNDGGGFSGGLLFLDGGKLDFSDTNSSLTIEHARYTLVSDIKTLASDIDAQPYAFYALANDYDASADGTYASAPVQAELVDTFEGLGHNISNLSIDSSDSDVGLFAVSDGTLRDIGLLKISIHSTGREANVGTLLGRSGSALLVGCYASGDVISDGNSAVGGLVGSSDSTFGGVVRSHSSANVTGASDSSVGGLAGKALFAISLSHANGNVIGGANSYVGGLYGQDTYYGAAQSYATGKVVGGANSTVGGLAGLISTSSGGMNDSYATGEVKGGKGSKVGGLVGEQGQGSYTETSYAIGLVRAKTAENGGLIGQVDSAGLAYDYWDTQTTRESAKHGCDGGKCNCRKCVGLTTEQFQTGLPEGFDPKIWAVSPAINNGYPYLIANAPPQ